MSTATTTDQYRIVTEAPRQALDLLRSPDADRLESVALASAHLAAVSRSLLPLAKRVLPESADVGAVRRAAAHLQVHLRRLEQLHSGDGLVSRIDRIAVHESTRDDLVGYLALLGDLMQRLFAEIGPDAAATAVAAYEQHLRRAPTRPHPHAPTRGALGVAAFRLGALRDRVLDTMDGRHVPVPRPARPVREPGRWGRYLLGE